VALLAIALAIAALALFFLPALLGVGGGGGGGGSASPSPSGSGAVSSVEPSPTTAPVPTQQTYVVKAGDTMSKIAKQFGVTSEQLCNANKGTIKNCDKIAIGDQLVIPAAAPSEFIQSAAPAPSAS
jgi:LysM repeat protein